MTTPTVKAPEAKAMPSGAKRKNDEQAEPKKVCKTAEGDEAMQKEKLKQELRERHKIALQTKETARLKTLKTASWNVLDNTGPAPSSPITPPLPKQPPLTKQDTKEAEDLVKAVRIQERKDWWMSTISGDQRLSRASRRLLDVFMKASDATVCDYDASWIASRNLQEKLGLMVPPQPRRTLQESAGFSTSRTTS